MSTRVYWWPFGWVWCWWKHGGHQWNDEPRCVRCGTNPYAYHNPI
jgi:hypothetical protein